MNIIVVGGGAAGFFGAIAAAGNGHQVTILEAGRQVLDKVRISGGGRCNVTHHCFDPAALVQAYPRGGNALRGPFSRFQPSDTVEWFARHGVKTKTEQDGRMFPVTDDSDTIVQCLQGVATDVLVRVQTGSKVVSIQKRDDQFDVELRSEKLFADKILLATGGSRPGFALAQSLGHEIVSPVPSLFTFVVQDQRIEALPGVSVEPVDCQLVTPTKTFKQTGPVLITHWGMSGPAVLRLSSWAARELHDANYNATLRINWLSGNRGEQVRETLESCRKNSAKKVIANFCPWPLPKRLWRALVTAVGVEELRWSELPKKAASTLVQELTDAHFLVAGKGQFKEEFVTCGGVKLDEVDFRSMESRRCEGLYFAGEILDIDGITGGFNFQNAWTTAWIAGNSM